MPGHATSPAGATAALAELVAGLAAGDVSAHAADLVRRGVVDALGCAVAGAELPDAAIVAGWAATLGGTPDATLLASPHGRAPAALAALVNGTAGHALDFDDVSPTMHHPSVCLVPALLAVGERERVTGRELELAYVAGFEVSARICRAINPPHYARGWHSTSTVGGMAAAAGVARLLGLDAGGVATAIGIAASMAAGMRQNFGTMVKPLHAGLAAQQGVMAAELAARGTTAQQAILDGPRGFLDVYRGDGDAPVDATRLLRPEGGLEIDDTGIAFKRFACCGAIHTALEALLGIMQRERLTPGDVAHVRCSTNRAAPEILIHHTASTPEEGRFCVEYSLAVALLDGEAGPRQYRPERIADPALQALARSIEVVVDDELATGSAVFPAIVAVRTHDGAEHVARLEAAPGRPDDPFTWDQLDAKFLSCTADVLGPDAARDALRIARSLPDLEDVGELARALAPAGTDPA